MGNRPADDITYLDAVYLILLQNGNPMGAEEILDGIQARGLMPVITGDPSRPPPNPS